MISNESIHKANWYVYLLRRIQPRPKTFEESPPLPTLKASGSGSRLYYVGMTNVLSHRLARHNAGEVPSTHGHQWELMAYAVCVTRKEAALLERWLKNGDSRAKRERFIVGMGEDCIQRDACSLQYIRIAQYWSAKQLLAKNFKLNERKVHDDAVQRAS